MLTCAILPLLGAVVGWFANHWLSSARDRRARQHALEDARDARKRHFLSFMSGFRSETELTHPTEFEKLFLSRIHKLREEVAKIRPDIDFDRQEAFSVLITQLSHLTGRDMTEVADGGNYLGRKRVTGTRARRSATNRAAGRQRHHPRGRANEGSAKAGRRR
jgi:hypothetical protein